MAGLYPTNKTVQLNGQKTLYPGVDATGKYTSGDLNDPLVPPSRLDAETVNLVIDNLNSLIESMGSDANNTNTEQLATLFSSAAIANKGIKRDSAGRAKVTAPRAADDIARKAEVDAEANTRIAMDGTLQQNINLANTERYNNDVTLTNKINAEANTLKNLLTSFFARRDNPHAVSKSQVGLGLCDNTRDSTKNVNYANRAGSASANGGNANTISGIGIEAINPIIASSFGRTSSYIKYRNGLLIQWGDISFSVKPYDLRRPITFPVAFTNLGYATFVFAKDNSYITYATSISDKRLNGFRSHIYGQNTNNLIGLNWFSIGK